LPRDIIKGPEKSEMGHSGGYGYSVALGDEKLAANFNEELPRQENFQIVEEQRW